MTNTPTFRFIWTRRAVDRFLSTGTRDPRHTISNMPAALASPWLADDLDRYASGSPWLLLDPVSDAVVAASAEYTPYVIEAA